MGWRGRGRYPGNGPFRDLPPYQRPGRIYGYGRGMGYGRGYGFFGSRYGRGVRYSNPYSCARFPWLPRWWWTDPKYESMPYPPAPDVNAELERLQAERKALEKNIDEMKKHVKEGTMPAVWSEQPYYSLRDYPGSPEEEKKILEEQMKAIKKRLENLKEGD
jgi:hypothetical protein